MSIYVMSLAWKGGPVDRNDLLVLLAIADFCDDQGFCWPSMKSISEKARMTERGVQKIVRRLEEEGYIDIKTGNGRKGCNEYRVHLSKLHNPEPETPNDVHPEPRSPRTERTETPNRSAQNPERPFTRTVKNLKEPSERGRASVQDVLGKVLRPDIAEAFIDHRKSKGAALTAHSAKLIAESLTGHPDPDAVVEASIRQGWTGVFPEKVSAAKPIRVAVAEADRLQAKADWVNGDGFLPSSALTNTDVAALVASGLVTKKRLAERGFR